MTSHSGSERIAVIVALFMVTVSARDAAPTIGQWCHAQVLPIEQIEARPSAQEDLRLSDDGAMGKGEDNDAVRGKPRTPVPLPSARLGMTSRRSVMEPETETCPLSEVEDIDSLSVSELKARLRSETGERRRAQCMAEIQSHVMQLKLDLLDQEPDPDNFFRLLLRALLDRTESQACGVWLLDDEGAQCELWMAYVGDRFYSKDDWGD